MPRGRLILLATVAAALLAATAPARAQSDDWRRHGGGDHGGGDHRGGPDRRDWGHGYGGAPAYHREWREPHWRPGGGAYAYAPPPVYYPPQYYAQQPAYCGPGYP